MVSRVAFLIDTMVGGWEHSRRVFSYWACSLASGTWLSTRRCVPISPFFRGTTMPSESLQHKLDRVRRPRVQITYDVETGGAMQKTELPFVMGIMADLSGSPKEPL